MLQIISTHSSPFNSRYSDIIKSPMDLGTMTKKLKNMQYSSKKDFADDLNLIWSNCMIYSIFRSSYLCPRFSPG